MDHSLSVTVVDSPNNFFKILAGHALTEIVIRLRHNMLEQLLTRNVFLHQINVVLVVVGLEVLDNVGVVESLQHFDFIFDELQIEFELFLVQDFYGNLQVRVVDGLSSESDTVCTFTKDFLLVDYVVFIEFFNALLFRSYVTFHMLQ